MRLRSSVIAPSQSTRECGYTQGENTPYSRAIKLSKSRHQSVHVNLLRLFDPSLLRRFHSCILVVFANWSDKVDFALEDRSCDGFAMHRGFHMSARLVWGWLAAKDAEDVSEHALTSTRAWRESTCAANVIQRLSLPAC